MNNTNRIYLSLFVFFGGIIALIIDLHEANYTFTNISVRTLIFAGLIVLGIVLLITKPKGKK